MRNKIEIKVYLPIKMVGELESRSKNGVRSKFIEAAIRARIDDEEAFKVSDIETRTLLAVLHSRIEVPEHIKQLILLELNS